jgi:hypothetical protein
VPETFTVAEIGSAVVKLAADGVTVTVGVVGLDGGGLVLPPPPPPQPANRKLTALATTSVNVPNLALMFLSVLQNGVHWPGVEPQNGECRRCHATDTKFPESGKSYRTRELSPRKELGHFRRSAGCIQNHGSKLADQAQGEVQTPGRDLLPAFLDSQDPKPPGNRRPFRCVSPVSPLDCSVEHSHSGAREFRDIFRPHKARAAATG